MPFLLSKRSEADRPVEHASYAHWRIAVSDALRETCVSRGDREEHVVTVPSGIGPRTRPPGRTVASPARSTFRDTGRRLGCILHAADVFGLPSPVEGVPVALIEAMEAGLPGWRHG